MPAHRRPHPTSLGGNADEIEGQFYDALQRGDLDALMALWADDDDVVCVHPGGPRIVGTTAIRASFEAIFARGRIPVKPERVRRLPFLGGVLHHLVERIDVPGDGGKTQTAWVIASNVYVKTAHGWRIAAHHASAGPAEEVRAQPEAPSTLH